MCKNAKSNLEKALDELCCCENHLNTAYIHADDDSNREKIHAALRAVGHSLHSAQKSLHNYKD